MCVCLFVWVWELYNDHNLYVVSFLNTTHLCLCPPHRLAHCSGATLHAESGQQRPRYHHACEASSRRSDAVLRAATARARRVACTIARATHDAAAAGEYPIRGGRQNGQLDDEGVRREVCVHHQPTRLSDHDLQGLSLPARSCAAEQEGILALCGGWLRFAAGHPRRCHSEVLGAHVPGAATDHAC